jgi:hypothetical protein
MLEAQIAAVAQQFVREVTKLENLKAGTQANISLEFKSSPSYAKQQGGKLTLTCHFFDGSNFGTVEAGSLGALMDEVHRRCGFADKQAVVIDRNNASLTALEAPKGWDSVES